MKRQDLSFIHLPLSTFSAADTQLKIPNRFLPVDGTVLETGEIPVGRSGGGVTLEECTGLLQEEGKKIGESKQKKVKR